MAVTVTLPFAFCLTDTVLSISILSDFPFRTTQAQTVGNRTGQRDRAAAERHRAQARLAGKFGDGDRAVLGAEAQDLCRADFDLCLADTIRDRHRGRFWSTLAILAAMPGFAVPVIPAFLAFVFLPPFLRAAGMAAVRLCTSGVAALVAVVAFGAGDVGPDHHRACCERAREARRPGNGHELCHQICHLLAPYWCRRCVGDLFRSRRHMQNA